MNEKPDMVLFTLALILILLGVLMVFNAGTAAGQRFYGNQDAFLVRQALFALIGIVAMLFFVFYNYKKLEGMAMPIVLGSTFLLLAVLIPGIGKVANNARRWIVLGPLQIQPSEFVKLAVIVYLSMILTKKQREGTNSTFRGFLPPLIVLLFFFSLIFVEPDFSTATILLFTGLAIFFVGGVPLGHLFGLVLSSIPFVVVLVFSKAYMRSRLFAHIDPLSDVSRQGYHVIQSLLSFQRGGFWGVGIGKGQQKMGALPESHTDFIIPAHAEEIGFLGVFIILSLLFVLVARVFMIALRAPDNFSRLFAFGTGFLIAWQALINIGVVAGLLPATGLPFPFLSAGGSSLLVFCIAIGVVLNISKHCTRSTT